MINVNSLGYVVNQALADVELPASTHFIRFLNWAVKGYKVINLLGMMPNIKTVSLPINQETRTAQLPQDYIDYIRIGICCRGIFINLAVNEEICLRGTNMPESCCGSTNEAIENNIACMCDSFTQNSQQCCNEYGTWYWPMWSNGVWDYSAPNFGIGPGTYPGGFRINPELREIQFDSCVRAETFTMEYISNGFDDMGNAIVPDDAIPTLVAYIHWQRCMFERAPSPMETQWLRREAENHHRQFLTYLSDWNHRQNSMTKYDILDVIRRYTFQGVKA